MKVTMYCPSRNRWGYLGYSISSWIQNATNPKSVEIIVAIDEDDYNTKRAVEQINRCVEASGGNSVKTVITERYGYEYLDKYHNEAGKIFTGESFITLGDEMICGTRGWDEELINLLKPNVDKPTFVWVDCDANNFAYGKPHPLPRVYGINRKWYEKTKKIAGWRAADVYYSRLLGHVGDFVNVIHPKFEVLNLREESDITFNEGRGGHMERGHFDDLVPGEFERDIASLTENTGENK